jgi:RND family efflux transporter MFP subunit
LHVVSTVLSTALLLSAVPGCGKAPAEEAAPPARPVKLLTVTPDGRQGALELPAEIRARDSVELAFNVPGQVTELPALEGTPVEAGAMLASLDNSDYRARLLAAQAAHELAQAEFDRYSELVANGAVAVAELDHRKAALQSARSELELVRKQFDDTVLRAPFDGLVARRMVQRFANVQAKQPVLLFQSLSPLDVVIDVPEPLVLRTEPGRARSVEAVVRFENLPGVALPVTLREIKTEADPQTRTFQVVFALEDTGGLTVLPGMSAILEAHRDDLFGKEEIFLVPPLAVEGAADGHARVWVYDPQSGTVEPRPVEIGMLHDGGVEVRSGLKAGEQIVTAGISQLKAGMRVRPLDSLQ